MFSSTCADQLGAFGRRRSVSLQESDGAAIETREHASTESLSLMGDDFVSEVSACAQQGQTRLDRRKISDHGIDFTYRLDHYGDFIDFATVAAPRHPSELTEDRHGNGNDR